jgi:hypothetical protein
MSRHSSSGIREALCRDRRFAPSIQIAVTIGFPIEHVFLEKVAQKVPVPVYLFNNVIDPYAIGFWLLCRAYEYFQISQLPSL